MEIAANCLDIADQQPPPVGRPAKRRHVATKPKLPTRLDLDGRSNAAKQFDAIVGAVTADLGGSDQLSAIELRLVESFAGATVLSESMNIKLLLGQPVDHAEFCAVASTLVRLASRLGLQRRPRPVNEPSLSQYLADAQARSSADAESFVSRSYDGEAVE